MTLTINKACKQALLLGGGGGGGGGGGRRGGGWVIRSLARAAHERKCVCAAPRDSFYSPLKMESLLTGCY